MDVRKLSIREHMKKLSILNMLAILLCLVEFSHNLPISAQEEMQQLPAQIPAPQAVALPPPASVNGTTAPLSWRNRALALANEYPLKKNSLAWGLPITYRKVSFLLKQAIAELGLNLTCQYEDAGHFLFTVPNRKGDIIIISQPASEINSLLKMHIYADYPAADMAKISSLPEKMKTLLENQGLWQ